MNYREYFPQQVLADYVKCYWVLESDVPHPRERIFPDGSIELIFHYRDLFRKYTSDGLSQLQQRNFVHGQLTSFIELEATGQTGVFSVRFTPAGLQPFISLPVSDLTGSTVAIGEVWPEEGCRLSASMQAASGSKERIRLVEAFLLEKLATVRADYQTGISCVKALTANEFIPIDELARQLNMSRRSLERKFTASVGLSPRLFTRIIRFNKALNLIADRNFSSFTCVAHTGGFYDQAHFIKDFKEFTGLNPKQYFSENLEMVKHFNLD